MALAIGALPFAAIAAGKQNPAAVVALLREQDTAILQAGERLIVANRRFCPNPGWSAGMTVQRLSQYGAPYRPAAAVLLGLGDAPTVTVIAPESAAAAAGLVLGDRIVAINEQRIPVTPARGSAGEFAGIGTVLDTLDAALLADGTARLEIERDKRSIIIKLAARPACRARFDVRAGRAAPATSDGVTIQVSSDLVAEADRTDELAAILAHELAHNILRHPQRLKAQGVRPSVRRTEVEADRLSVYVLDAAGYPPVAAVAFWARWGKAHDLGILADGSHPGWKQRIASIKAEITVIATTQAAGRAVELPVDLLPPS